MKGILLEGHSISEKSNNNLELAMVKDLHENISKNIELCQQGLLRQDEFRKIIDNIQTQLLEILDPNSIEGRKFEKLTKKTVWLEHTPESGKFVLKSDCSYLINWEELLSEILNSYTKNSSQSELIEEEKFMGSGKPYSAKKMIHSILKTATKEIAIQDNFLDESIFGLLENTSTDLVIKLMGKKVKGAFLQFLKAFSDERKQDVSYKINKNCHDRFIIIDQTTVYHLGPSIKDAGNKAGMINKITSEKEKEKILTSFKKWWE